MAIGTANCKCEHCGKEFQRKKKCYNRREADEFESWAADNLTCDECYKKMKQEERIKENEKNAELLAEMNLPKLIGTEKQIKYAENLREKYILTYEEKFKELQEAIKSFNSPETEKVLNEKGLNKEEVWQDFLNKTFLNEMYLCLTSKSSKDIIEQLKRHYF